MDNKGRQGIQHWLRSAAQQLSQAAVMLAVASAAVLAPSGAAAREPSPAADPPAIAMAVVALKDLPAQAQKTHELIRHGGPFPHAKDGSAFGNREHQLPSQARGYYREYTVASPGSSNRGALRIVCGGRKPTTPDACFYTQDHYASFRRISL